MTEEPTARAPAPAAPAPFPPEEMVAEMKRRLPILAEPPDAWVRRMMRWHFSPETGSPFWLRRRETLGFDPIEDVRTVADLALFGRFDKRPLITQPVRDLLPRGFRDRPARVFETGGSQGPSGRILDVTSGGYNVEAYRVMLEARGLAGGDVIAMTPSGPHPYGTFVSRLARSWGGLAFFVDFDPRWVKRLVAAESSPAEYVRHLVRQTVSLVESQKPRLLFTTSRLLLELAPELGRPLRELGILGVATGGTGCSAEEARYLEESYLEGVQWIDTYGNTLVGHALQGDPWPGWPTRSYYLVPPLGYLRVVDPDDWRREVAPGERGRVLAITLLEDLFIPNLPERDSAVRVGPHPWFPWDGVADVRIFQDEAQGRVIEGVY